MQPCRWFAMLQREIGYFTDFYRTFPPYEHLFFYFYRKLYISLNLFHTIFIIDLRDDAKPFLYETNTVLQYTHTLSIFIHSVLMGYLRPAITSISHTLTRVCTCDTVIDIWRVYTSCKNHNNSTVHT